VLIPGKRKLVGETVTLTAATVAAAAAPASGTKSSIKSRLGEPVVPVSRDPQPSVMIPAKRTLTDETVSSSTASGMQAKTAKLSTKLSAKSRLGELATSESQPPQLKVPLDRKLSDDDDGDDDDDEGLSCVVLPQYKSVFSRLGRM